MQKELLTHFKSWFSQYVMTFYSASAERQRNIVLKEQHTQRVCREIAALSNDLGLDGSDQLLAETAALFHDLGRFEQWRQYGTFSDARSENHALIALRVLDEQRILAVLPPEEQDLIKQAVRYHNTLHVPEMESPMALLITRLLRDADKLDIWQLFVNHFYAPADQQDTSVEWDLPETPGCSMVILSDLHNHQISSLTSIQNRNDFKLLLLGWVFDINFSPTHRQILQRRYIEHICKFLPQVPEIQTIEAEILAYLHKRAQISPRERACLPPPSPAFSGKREN
ncbi:MAG: HD domain-containing protein [bacterium]